MHNHGRRGRLNLKSGGPLAPIAPNRTRDHTLVRGQPPPPLFPDLNGGISRSPSTGPRLRSLENGHNWRSYSFRPQRSKACSFVSPRLMGPTKSWCRTRSFRDSSTLPIIPRFPGILAPTGCLPPFGANSSGRAWRWMFTRQFDSVTRVPETASRTSGTRIPCSFSQRTGQGSQSPWTS
jgi:hypothetical protein